MADKSTPDIYGPDGELDPLKFVLNLRRSGEQARIVASVRPTWMDLAGALKVLRTEANELLLDGGSDQQFSRRGLREGTPGSQALHDQEAQLGHALNPSNTLMMELLSDYVLATSDHLWGMCVLLASNPPFRPLLASGRILLEAGAHVRYLLEPGQELGVRVVRAANVELDAIRQELKDIPDPTSTDGDLLKARKVELLVSGEDDGLIRPVSKNKEIQDFFLPALMAPGDMADLVLSKGFGQYIWRVASSVVHAKDRTVLRLITEHTQGDNSEPGRGNFLSMTFLAPCLLAMTETYNDVSIYLGRQSPALETAISNVLWIAQAMSGKYDEALLDRAGIDRSGWV